MESFLHWYFGSTFSVWFAIGVILTWIFSVGVYAKTSKKGKNWLVKRWWYWVGTLITVLHLYFISYINPSYFGYGTPNYFTLIDVEDNYVVLYDTRYAYIEDEDNRHDEYIPNLRVHLIDRLNHERVYWELIGDYYFPEIYGQYVLLKENNTYSNNSDDRAIQSLKRFDVTSRKIETIVEEEEYVQIDGQKVKAQQIIFDQSLFFIKSPQGDQYVLNLDEPVFSWYNGERAPIEKALFTFTRSPNSNDKKRLVINKEDSERDYLFGNLANFVDDMVIVFSHNDLDKTNPQLSLVNSFNEELWVIDLNLLKEITGNNDLKYIHRSLPHEDVCYVTSHEYLFEFDLYSGELNWWVKI